VLDRAIALRGRGAYVLQAAIASLQAEPEIDWAGVAVLYAERRSCVRAWTASSRCRA
jgi:RNA polymerase sigma-70 factor (ECF subfamily)